MTKIISFIILVLLIILTPPAVLAYISQDAVPGDMAYPIKRKLEDGILLLASIHPTTKAYFSLAFSQRRFKEAKALIAQGKDANQTLGELSSQINSAVTDVIGVKNKFSKKELISDLKKDFLTYERELKQVKEKLDKELLVEPQSPSVERVVLNKPVPQKSDQTEAKLSQQKRIGQTLKDIEKAKEDIEKEKEELDQEIQEDLERAAEQGDSSIEIPGLSDEIRLSSDLDKLFDELGNVNVNEFLRIIPD